MSPGSTPSISPRFQVAPLPSGELAQFVRAHPYPFLVLCRARTPPCAPDFDHTVYLFCDHDGDSSRTILVGRGDDCDIVIRDRQVSRHHAVFERLGQDGDYFLWDRGSRNGTRINGVLLAGMRAQPVESKSVIQFGVTCFVFLSAEDLFMWGMKAGMGT